MDSVISIERRFARGLYAYKVYQVGTFIFSILIFPNVSDQDAYVEAEVYVFYKI